MAPSGATGAASRFKTGTEVLPVRLPLPAATVAAVGSRREAATNTAHEGETGRPPSGVALPSQPAKEAPAGTQVTVPPASEVRAAT